MTWRHHIPVLGLSVILGACSSDSSTEPLKSLGDTKFSAKYHSAFWSEQADKKTPVWSEAQRYCRASDHADSPNCRVVVAVDLTVRVLPVHQGDDLNARIRQWIRSGTKDLGLPSPNVMPTPDPKEGFGPERVPTIPRAPAR